MTQMTRWFRRGVAPLRPAVILGRMLPIVRGHYYAEGHVECGGLPPLFFRRSLPRRVRTDSSHTPHEVLTQ
jgi:hypothetical protein